ncbi:methylated-DNA--[protein]-cysteine S-methyltransferase [Enterobacter bugandensis]|uniref:bifunctional transcriptional activator/DNA repair enzyme AdaA n=1 Tax=Enterobacter bugandensis TaxID=881260 RepID=UPI0021CF372E|nr:methylated-DNA--[protein]-cysteine S-methyltransferase [Enterobacter bugandensis]MCU6161352.1 methylated-DNA--[protein]-cysteine S-methyltransferase [Enterobacter bugandensis]
MKITDKNLCDIWYQALLERDSEYTGVFIVGVKTTGVFCISVCRARKPRRDNVEFYKDAKSALADGFRPCKVCRPAENAHSAPLYVEQALALVRRDIKSRVADAQLRQHGISPERVRRWFLQHHGITFQAFQRMQRVNVALQELKSGRAATDAAPTQATEVIVIHRFTTTLGPMFVCATERGVCLLEFTGRRMLETEFRDIQRLFNARIVTGENSHTRQTVKEIGEYFAGTRRQFELSVDAPGSDFQQSVWHELRAVPYGQTSHYQAISLGMNKSNALRAVAAANGANRIAIVIPCHRIIGKDGKMTGYGGGISRKEWLIEHERNNI